MASNVSLRALWNGYDINYAVKMVLTQKLKKILKSLTNLSLAKVYYTFNQNIWLSSVIIVILIIW